MGNWIAREFDWILGRYTGNYYNIAQAGIVAVFVDSHFGLDTNAGTAIAPFRTLTRAITHLNTNGANGSRIFMNGIFSETFPAQTFAYRFIGCGGGRNGRTIFWGPLPQARASAHYENIQLMNYDGVRWTPGVNTHCWYLNILAVNTVFTAVEGFIDGTSPVAYHSIFSGVRGGTTWDPWRVNAYHCIFHLCFGARDTFSEIFGSNNFVSQLPLVERPTYQGIQFRSTSPSNNAYISGLGGFVGNNLLISDPQFINPANNDFNVRITSPLLRAGSIDDITGIRANIGGVQVGLPYNGLNAEFNVGGGATITNLTVDANGRFTLTPPNRTGTLVSGVMDLANIYPIENIDLFNVFDFLSGQITQGVFETFVSPKMSLTIRIRYGNTVAELDACPWLLIEYGKLPTFSGTGASRVGNAAPTFTAANFQTITCRFLRISLTLQNNS